MAKRIELPSWRARRVCFAAAALMMAAVATPAAASGADDYPSRTVRLVVPFAPGGSSDSVARMIGATLTEAWGQQVLVDNRPGGDTIIGASLVTKSKPDGYTLLLANANHTVNPALRKSLPYDPVKDFTPVVRIANQTVVLMVHPSVPAKSVKEFIQLAKARPRQLAFASPGVGTASHMTGVLFQALTGIEMLFVPYKGAGPSLIDLIAGQVTVGSSGLTSSMQYIDSGRLRALGVTTATRSRLKPEIPTIAESGVPGFEVTNWFGILAPAGTPPAIVERIHQQVARILQNPANEQLVFKLGLEPAVMAPREFEAFMRGEVDKWLKVVREMRIEPN